MEIVKSFGRKWHCSRDGDACGTVIWREARVEWADVFQQLIQASNLEATSQLTADLDGFFAIVARSDSRVLLVADRIRSVPLFYAVDRARLLLSDDATWVADRMKKVNLNPVSRIEVLSVGYVTGSATLLEGLSQLQAGEVVELCWNGETWIHRSLARRPFVPRLESQEKHELIHSRYNTVIERVFNRAGSALKNRRICVPLSGGLDSRLVALTLRRMGIQDVLTYAYGNRSSEEVRLSRQVASDLGYTWEHIEYTPEKWGHLASQGDWLRSFRKGGGLCSVLNPHQELAVAELSARGLVDSQTVFLPGYTADVLAGSHMTTHVSRGIRGRGDAEVLADAIIDGFYWPSSPARQDGPSRAQCRFKLKRWIDEARLSDELLVVLDAWDYCERQPKFIVNSLRTFDFRGFDWWLPFFDREYVDFWQTVSAEWRLNRKLHVEVIEGMYAKVTGRPSPGRAHTSPSKSRCRCFANAVKRMAAKWVDGIGGVTIRRLRLERRARHVYESNEWGWYGLVGFDRYLDALVHGRTDITAMLSEVLLEDVDALLIARADGKQA